MNYTVFDSLVGKIKVIEEENKVIKIEFVKDEKNINPNTKVLKLAKKELEEYFCGKRKNFTFPFKVDGKEEHMLEAIRYRSLSNKYWS